MDPPPSKIINFILPQNPSFYFNQPLFAPAVSGMQIHPLGSLYLLQYSDEVGELWVAARRADGKEHSKHGIREVCELQAGFGEGAVQIIDGGYDQSHPFDR